MTTRGGVFKAQKGAGMNVFRLGRGVGLSIRNIINEKGHDLPDENWEWHGRTDAWSRVLLSCASDATAFDRFLLFLLWPFLLLDQQHARHSFFSGFRCHQYVISAPVPLFLGTLNSQLSICQYTDSVQFLDGQAGLL